MLLYCHAFAFDCIVLVKDFNISNRSDFTIGRPAICQDLLSLYCFFPPPLLVPSRKSISKDNGSAKPSFVLQTGLRSGLSHRTMWLLCHYANICIYTECAYYIFIALLILPEWADGSAVGLLKVISLEQFFFFFFCLASFGFWCYFVKEKVVMNSSNCFPNNRNICSSYRLYFPTVNHKHQLKDQTCWVTSTTHLSHQSKWSFIKLFLSLFKSSPSHIPTEYLFY